MKGESYKYNSFQNTTTQRKKPNPENPGGTLQTRNFANIPGENKDTVYIIYVPYASERTEEKRKEGRKKERQEPRAEPDMKPGRDV